MASNLKNYEQLEDENEERIVFKNANTSNLV